MHLFSSFSGITFKAKFSYFSSLCSGQTQTSTISQTRNTDKKGKYSSKEDLCWNEYKNSECLGYLQKNYIIPTSASQYYKYTTSISGNLSNGCCWEIIWFTMMGFSLLYSSLLNHAKLARLKQSRKAIAEAPFYSIQYSSIIIRIHLQNYVFMNIGSLRMRQYFM